jgi:hypothetical protein
MAAAVALTATPLVAAEGVLIVQKVTNGTTTTTAQSQIEKTRMRSEITTPTGRKQIVLFDGAAQVLRIIDEEAKTYSEISKTDAERMRSQFDGAMTQMQEQMKSMPPEQRARMEAIVTFRAGTTGVVSEVTDASRQNFPDSLFQVPAGYQKREFPGAGRGRGRQQ